MPAGIIAAVVAAGATAYSAYSASNRPGIPDNSTAATLNKEQTQLANLQKQLALAQTSGDNAKIAKLQQQIGNLKLVLAAQQNGLQQQAGNVPGNAPTPVVNVSGVQTKTLWAIGGLIALAIGYLFFRKK